MKKRPIKTKLLTALLTLCMVLSLAPISAFAESGAYAVKFYPGDYETMTKNDQIPFCASAAVLWLYSALQARKNKNALK